MTGIDPALFRRFVPEIAHRTTGEVLAHPGFVGMRRRYVADTTSRYRIAVFPGGWQSTVYRAAALGAIICLHAAFDPADRATWPTLTRLKQSFATLDLSSSRQIDDFVARLVETGYVVMERPEADGRLRLLRPTETLLAWERAVRASYYGVLDALYPVPGYGFALVQDPGFQKAQAAASLTVFDVIGRFLAENRDMLPFHGMYHGTNVLMHLAIDHEDGQPKAVAGLDVLREGYGVSRSHLRNVLTGAEAAGLLEWASPNRKAVRLTPRGLATVDRFIADTLSSHDLTYRMALMRMGVDPDKPPPG
ncbi:hypothetical protein FF100_25345 [Methylobacterium terricola]|uniref:Uncharacterized protein n=1 Tax=Methylobacterium terricola TaxID=2583531 RepID=A0A5C4LCJ9_9HYPH|nr:hypothetical protein [Methylobacterium terricola]TNC09916.1 hypothetical protein FF100_25345 [Methylobacterium terricola]